MSERDLSEHIASVRKRPAMYVGSPTNIYGFVHYFVDAVSLLLESGARAIRLRVDRDHFELEGDASIAIREREAGVQPFEIVEFDGVWADLHGLVLTGLSRELFVRTVGPQGTHELRYECGRRLSLEESARGGEPQTILRFCPDREILAVVGLSEAALASYFRRMSLLNAGVSFTIEGQGEAEACYFPPTRGIVDLFHSVAAPFQILHQPIRIKAVDSDLQMEVVFAFQTWRDDWVWHFINRGRAVQGGTHEDSFAPGLATLRAELGDSEPVPNGVVAVHSLIYPGVVWEGCVKERIGNEELMGRVQKLFLSAVHEELQAKAELRDELHLKNLALFDFPAVWKSEN